jgi:hypothetical protein
VFDLTATWRSPVQGLLDFAPDSSFTNHSNVRIKTNGCNVPYFFQDIGVDFHGSSTFYINQPIDRWATWTTWLKARSGDFVILDQSLIPNDWASPVRITVYITADRAVELHIAN